MPRRAVFMLFLAGFMLGAWLRDTLGPPPKQLPVRVECAPAAQRI